MAEELVCPIHGPYDASYGTCPYHQAEAGGGRPAAPNPLDEDELPTDLGGGTPPAAFHDEGDEPTDLAAGRRGMGILDLEDDELTELGRDRLDETEIEAVEEAVRAILWVKDGQRRGRIQKLRDGMLVGRKDGDLILDDPKVSNPHARFRVEEDQFFLWDFGSRNGSFVNGERIRAATPLNENDEIRMGATTFVLKILQ